MVFIASAQDVVTKLIKAMGAERKGLTLLDSTVMDLPGFGSELVEVVLSNRNPFLGRQLKDCAQSFSAKYRCGIVSTRKRAPGAGAGGNRSRTSSYGLTGIASTDRNNISGELSSSSDRDALLSVPILNDTDKRNDLSLENEEGPSDIGGDVELGMMGGSNHSGARRTETLLDDGMLSVSMNDANNGDNSHYSIKDGDDTIIRETDADEDEAKEENSGVVPQDEESLVKRQPSVVVSASYATDSNAITLEAGDVLLCIVKSSDIPDLNNSADFFVVSSVGSVPRPISIFGMIPLVIFVIMIAIVATGLVSITAASLAVAALLLIGGWVTANEIPKLLDVRLLMLMGCALSYSQ